MPEKILPTLRGQFARLLSRKFLLATGAVVIVTFAIPVAPEEKLKFLIWIVGLYLGANVAQKKIPEPTS